MKSLLNDQVIVITGASGGLGASMATEMIRRNAKVVIVARSEEKLKLLAATLGERCSYYPMDVSSMEQIVFITEQIHSDHGKIDVWINNAGYGVFEKFVDSSLETIADMMDINYMGTVRCTKAVLPYMLEAGRGHIINVASLAGKIGTPKGSAYGATKHAVLGFTNSLRYELRDCGVIVTSINPGPIDTPFFQRADPSGGYVENIKWMMLTPEKVAIKVADAISSKKIEIDMPFIAAFGAKLLQLFPRLLNGISGKLLNKK